MTDHDHTSDHTSDRTSHRPDAAADERIDALARATARELRRPAPADGIARVQRARRRRQTAQLGGAGVAAVAILAVGAIALGAGDAGPTVVPATVSTVDTSDTTTPTTPVPDTTVDTVPDTTDDSPPTSEPPDTPGSVAPDSAGAPEVVYTAAGFDAGFGSQVATVDPTTGQVTGTFTVDDAASLASLEAQNALVGKNALTGRSVDPEADRGYFTTEYDIGDITYSIDSLPSEFQSFEGFPAEALEQFDRCQQSALTVVGADASALPERISKAVFSPDGRWLVTVGGVCPEPGTLADGQTSITEPATVTRFDATRPDLPGVVLMDDRSASSIDRISFSADSSSLSIPTFGDVAELSFFDATSGDEIDPLGDLDDGCSATGTRWSRFIGPWIGDSSVAVQLDCADAHRLVVVDLATAETFTVDLPVDERSVSFTAEVDYGHYDRPNNVWFTVCDGLSAQCWIGQGTVSPLTKLPGAAQASFLPLGFTAGG